MESDILQEIIEKCNPDYIYVVRSSILNIKV